MKKYIVSGLSIGALLSPALVLAYETTFEGFINRISYLINSIIPVLIAFMVLLLIVGIVQYTTSADEEKHDKARKLIIAAFVGIVIIVCIWGIVRILVNTVGTDNSVLDNSYFPNVPCDPADGPCE